MLIILRLLGLTLCQAAILNTFNVTILSPSNSSEETHEDVQKSNEHSKKLYEGCQINEQCQEKTSNSFCSWLPNMDTTKICVCRPGYEARGNKCKIEAKYLNENCKLHEQCRAKTSNSDCSSPYVGKCICKNGYEAFGSKCLIKEYVCEDDFHCETKQPNFACYSTYLPETCKCMESGTLGYSKCKKKGITQDQTIKIVIGSFVAVFGLIMAVFMCSLVKRQTSSQRQNNPSDVPSVSEHVGCHCHELDKPPSYEDLLKIDAPPSYSTAISSSSELINENVPIATPSAPFMNDSQLEIPTTAVDSLSNKSSENPNLFGENQPQNNPNTSRQADVFPGTTAEKTLSRQTSNSETI